MLPVHILERATGHILQEDVEIVSVLVSAQVIDNVLMIEWFEKLDFVNKCLNLLFLCLWVCSKCTNWYLFDCDWTAVRHVKGIVDLAEWALTDDFVELEVHSCSSFLLQWNLIGILFYVVLLLFFRKVEICVLQFLEIVLMVCAVVAERFRIILLIDFLLDIRQYQTGLVDRRLVLIDIHALPVIVLPALFL